MAGTVVVDTLKSGTSSPPAFQNTSGTQIGTLCRAWVNFDPTAAAASMIRASFNVTSMTDTGTGDYTVNFTNAMSDASYAAVLSTGDYTDVNNTNRGAVTRHHQTTSIRVMLFVTSTGAAAEINDFNVAIFR